jgi:hypothetical protein
MPGGLAVGRRVIWGTRASALRVNTVFLADTGWTVINPGQTLRTAQIQHGNRLIPEDDRFLITITVRTLLEITRSGGEVIVDESKGLLDVLVTFLETDNDGTCTEQATHSARTFISLAALSPVRSAEPLRYREIGSPLC